MRTPVRASAKLFVAFCILALGVVGPALAQGTAEEPWVTYEGGEGPGEGTHIVFVSGDEEYRSEEALPQLAKILSYRHGFKSTVLFPIDPETGGINPNYQENIPGLEALDNADLMVLFTRFRALPEDQMEHILDYVNAGNPVIGMRTATHAFKYEEDSPYYKYSTASDVEGWEGGFGRQVLGETWRFHQGFHGRESTRGIVNGLVSDHPILQGVDDVWGPTDVYGIESITGDASVLLYGQSLAGMGPDAPPNNRKAVMPVAWVKNYTGRSGNTSRVFTTTMGASEDLESEGVRRMLVNAAYWAVGMEEQIPNVSDVETVGTYAPTSFGFDEFQTGLTPADFRADPEVVEQVLAEERAEPSASQIVGTWDYALDASSLTLTGTLKITEDGGELGGTMTGNGQSHELENVRYDGGFLTFETDSENGWMEAELQFHEDRFDGAVTLVDRSAHLSIEGTHQSD